MEQSEAQALLSSTQQLRIHWSGVITSQFGLSLSINVALWSYFIAAFIGSDEKGGFNSLYILVASSLSAFLLGLWRLYTRHIDDHIANLYSDLLHSESVLNISSDRGTSRYLSKAVPNVKNLINSDELKIKEKIKCIDILTSMKRMGERGHLNLDLFALLLILIISIISVCLIFSKYEPIGLFFLIGNIISIYFINCSITKFQRDPSEEYIAELISKYKNQSNDADK